MALTWLFPGFSLGSKQSADASGGVIVSQKSVKYDASHIQVLEGLEAVRKRPGMYIGSTDERGLHRLVFEAAGRAMDEVVAGSASRVEVALMPDGGVRVADDGPGVPFEGRGEVGDPGLEAQLTRLMVGRGPSSPRHLLLSSFGLGLAIVNALSSRLVAEVQREGVRRVQEYMRGVVVAPPADATNASGTGTTITFWPDAGILKTTECSFDALAERFRELAFLNRDLDVSLRDERRPADPRSARFRSPGGVREMVAFLDGQTAALVHPDVISFEREDARMSGTMEVALRWRRSGQERVRSFANSAPMLGGTHLVGFFEGVEAAINAYAREQRLLTAANRDLAANEIGQGLTAVVSVKLEYPQFEGATREMLSNAEAHTCVREALQEHLGTWLGEHPNQAAAVIGRIMRDTGRN